MIAKVKQLLAVEKGWLLSQIGILFYFLDVCDIDIDKGLIPDCDDDVMDEVR